MHDAPDALRDHLVRVLDWEDAHVGFDKAIDGIPADKRGIRPPGFEHSLWQLLEHIRIANEDIVDFCVNEKYAHRLRWPDDYWPAAAAPPDDKAWAGSIAAYHRSREQLKAILRTRQDLTATVPTGKGTQTYLRAILLAADHTAYHVGQMVLVRRATGTWA